MSALVSLQVLAGLPGTGPRPLQFSASGVGLQREGYVVEFTTSPTESWIGNFQPGLTSLYVVLEEPSTSEVTVIAGGQAYVVEPTSGHLKREYGGGIESALPLVKLRALLLTACGSSFSEEPRNSGVQSGCPGMECAISRSKQTSYEAKAGGTMKRGIRSRSSCLPASQRAAATMGQRPNPSFKRTRLRRSA